MVASKKRRQTSDVRVSGKSLNVTLDAVYELISSGLVTSDEIMDAIAEGLEEYDRDLFKQDPKDPFRRVLAKEVDYLDEKIAQLRSWRRSNYRSRLP